MTIYALSSGPGISGIAVIRVSGNDTAGVIAAASQISSNAANTSLTVKSIRIFMIGPMIILSTFLINNKNEKSYSTPKRLVIYFDGMEEKIEF